MISPMAAVWRMVSAMTRYNCAKLRVRYTTIASVSA